MGWYPCCCDDCVVLADNFERADSSNLGPNWVEESGDWTIDGERLKLATVASDKWVRTAEHDGLWAQVEAVVRSSAAGDQLRIGVGDALTTPKTPVVVAELTVGGAGVAKLRILEGATVRAECDVTAPIDTDHALKLCVGLSDFTFHHPSHDDDYFYAVWLNGVRVLSTTFDYPASSVPYGWCGVGGVTGVPEFDGFVLTTLRDREYAANCPRCFHCCWPHADELPVQMQVVVAGMSGGGAGECSAGECADLNGTYVLDRAEPPEDNDGVCGYYELAISRPCDGATLTKLRLFINSRHSGSGEPDQGCELEITFHDGSFNVLHGFASSDPASPYYTAGNLCGATSPTITPGFVVKCGGGTFTLTPV